ncbi:RNA methyltransferase [Crocinitomicaceae bacterium CZZ-1]|uniref:tRNA (guanosine(18)-2'-O)-methyltransferase n=1 Tax=Taishania pollutisoli TaxID=2766479 RepID=A0A8J6PDX8_9FLAO|nr:RNA methyltransferase [Taishania pollutisoli]MBC9811855.1 RNA methyltransferase [Taishania pollutisoli]
MKTFDEIVLEQLYGMITPSKVEMFERLAPMKSDYLTVVLENIYQEHNASAVLRTCESFGVQSLHIIEKDCKYQVQRDIARGAGRWVDMYNYNDENPTITCLQQLKSKGYRILATTPHENDCTIDTVSIDKPMALVFGTEGDGISQDVIGLADEFVKIPMYGFTESFNISVSAAISMYALRSRLEKSDINWKMTPEELVKLKINWCTRIIPHGNKVVPEVIKRLKVIFL